MTGVASAVLNGPISLPPFISIEKRGAEQSRGEKTFSFPDVESKKREKYIRIFYLYVFCEGEGPKKLDTFLPDSIFGGWIWIWIFWEASVLLWSEKIFHSLPFFLSSFHPQLLDYDTWKAKGNNGICDPLQMAAKAKKKKKKMKRVYENRYCKQPPPLLNSPGVSKFCIVALNLPPSLHENSLASVNQEDKNSTN